MTIQTTGPAASYETTKDGPAGEVLYAVAVRVERTAIAAKAAIRSAKARLEAADAKFYREVLAAEEAGNYAVLDLPANDARRLFYDQYMYFSARAGVMADMLSAFLAVPDDAELNPHMSEPWTQIEKFCRKVEEIAIVMGMTDANQSAARPAGDARTGRRRGLRPTRTRPAPAGAARRRTPEETETHGDDDSTTRTGGLPLGIAQPNVVRPLWRDATHDASGRR